MRNYLKILSVMVVVFTMILVSNHVKAQRYISCDAGKIYIEGDSDDFFGNSALITVTDCLISIEIRKLIVTNVSRYAEVHTVYYNYQFRNDSLSLSIDDYNDFEVRKVSVRKGNNYFLFREGSTHLKGKIGRLLKRKILKERSKKRKI